MTAAHRPIAILALAVLLAPLAIALNGSYDPPKDPPSSTLIHKSSKPISAVEISPGGVLLFSQLGGPVFRLDPEDKQPKSVFEPPVIVGPEWGLTGLALAPDFDETGVFYAVYMTGPPGSDPTKDDVLGTSRVVRVEDGKETLVYEYPATRFHNSGRILLHDGLLFLSRGENNKRMTAQDPKSEAGKILRMTLDGKPAPGNPGEGNPAWSPYVYSLGHRNPFGLAWDHGRGVLVESEVGQASNEEVNMVHPGKNYGWPHCQGYCKPENSTFVDPLVMYPKVITPVGAAVIGTDYYIGSFNGHDVRRIFETPKGWKDEVVFKHTTLLLDLERSLDGKTIYFGAWNGLWKIPTPQVSVDSMAGVKGPEDGPGALETTGPTPSPTAPGSTTPAPWTPTSPPPSPKPKASEGSSPPGGSIVSWAAIGVGALLGGIGAAHVWTVYGRKRRAG